VLSIQLGGFVTFMSRLPYAASFRDLIVYQRARQLALEIFQMTKVFPKGETFSLTDQVSRSSRSIGAQIAEAWAKRDYERHFQSKLTDADAEQQETQHWIDSAFDCGYISEKQASELRENCEEIGRLLGCMIAKSEQFCNPQSRRVREVAAEYFVKSADIEQ
jgi:four helix bundle protein